LFSADADAAIEATHHFRDAVLQIALAQQRQPLIFFAAAHAVFVDAAITVFFATLTRLIASAAVILLSHFDAFMLTRSVLPFRYFFTFAIDFACALRAA
jgi:hypothetical protein